MAAMLSTLLCLTAASASSVASVRSGLGFAGHVRLFGAASFSSRRKSGSFGGNLRGALGLRVVNISKTKEKWADMACDDYAGRVKKMGVSVDQVLLKPAPGPPKFTAEQQKDEEGRTLLSRVDMASETLILLDERGDMLTSHGLAELLTKYEDDGVRTVTFAIGGAHGHGQEVQTKAHRMMSLSKMVMNHQIARVVLMEQLYRAYTIQRGVPYHK